jgi:site-specific recombinase XerD
VAHGADDDREERVPITRIGRKALATIKGAKVEGRKVYYDDELAGFALRVEPSGRITYFIEYRPGAGGRSVLKKRVNLGNAAELAPEEARKRASELLATVRLGGDPAADKKLERAVPTMKEFAGRFLEEEVETKLKAGTLRNYKSYVSKYIEPALGTAKLDKVQPDEIARLHRRIGKERPTVANRVIECLGSIYRYAAMCGFVPKGHNPAAGISAFRETARERFLSAAEMAKLGETLALAETDGLPWKASESKHVPKTKQATVIDAHATAAIRLLILTGLRLREVLHLRWTDVDFERGVALLADTKTGRRYAVLTAPALVILKELRPRRT